MLEAYNETLRTINFLSQPYNQFWWICRAWNDDHSHKISSLNWIKIMRYHDFNLEYFGLFIDFLSPKASRSNCSNKKIATIKEQVKLEKKEKKNSILSPISSLFSLLSSLLTQWWEAINARVQGNGEREEASEREWGSTREWQNEWGNAREQHNEVTCDIIFPSCERERRAEKFPGQS